MAKELPVGDAWQEHVVATRTLSGQVLFLVEVRKLECETCRYGTQVISTWSTASGETQRMTWCTSCFNADCLPTEPDERMRARLSRLTRRITGADSLTYWNGAKPAIEDLERRGLV
jgi:hypothetical protein